MLAALTHCKSNSVIFKVEHARVACCDHGHDDKSLGGREIILECIAAWYSSPDSFELQVQTEVRMAIIDQLSYKAFSYPPTLQAFTPNVWLRLGYAASNADNPIRQVVDLAQTSW